MRVPSGKKVISSWSAVPSVGLRKLQPSGKGFPRDRSQNKEKGLWKMDYMNSSEIDYSYYNNMTWDELGKYRLQAQQVVAMVIYIVVFVVGVPGNALVLWVTVSEARRSVNAIWFLNLAVADLLSCLVLPIHIMTALMHGNWLLGDTACHIQIAFFYFNLYASILFLAIISADRFLMVFKPIWCQKYRVAWRTWQASGVAWMLALVLTIPSCVFAVYFEHSLFQWTYCGVVLIIGIEHFDLALNITRFALTFLVPLVTMSVCYTCLLFQTWRRPATRSTKTLKVVVAMVTSFFVFWLPYQLYDMLSVFPTPPSLASPNWEIEASLYRIGMALASVNCCINPIIYVAASRGLHIQVFKFQPGRLRQLLTED